MTLQELLGELQDTRYSSNTTEISAVAVESYSDVVIVLKGV